MASKENNDEFGAVIEQFKQWTKDPETAHAVAAIKALTQVIKASKATTIMGLEKDLQHASAGLKQAQQNAPLSLNSGCELFTRFVTKTRVDFPDFETCKRTLIQRGEQFAAKSLQSRSKIASLADRFIRDGYVVLTHGFSRVVQTLLESAASQNKNFSVLITEARPDPSGYLTAARLQAAGIPVKMITDSAVAHMMETVDIVLCGAEAIVENGGIINKLGTYQVSIVANAFKKPFYVAAESFKFTRLYPLTQADVPELTRERKTLSTCPQCVPNIKGLDQIPFDTHYVDYTPPVYITLLFTELGVLTPSAVSDELIKLYYS